MRFLCVLNPENAQLIITFSSPSHSVMLRGTFDCVHRIGIAFPTCVSVNNTVAHFSPLESDPSSNQTLAKGDVVKIHLGAHIDGYAAVSAETLVVGASAEEPVTGAKADVIQAAWHAAEVVQRLVKVGNKNWQVTDAVNKVAAAFGCKAVEGAPWTDLLR